MFTVCRCRSTYITNDCIGENLSCDFHIDFKLCGRHDQVLLQKKVSQELWIVKRQTYTLACGNDLAKPFCVSHDRIVFIHSHLTAVAFVDVLQADHGRIGLHKPTMCADRYESREMELEVALASLDAILKGSIEHPEELNKLLFAPRTTRKQLDGEGSLTAIVADQRNAPCERASESTDFDFRCEIADLDERAIVVLVLEILTGNLDLIEGLILVLDEPVTERLKRVTLRLAVQNLLVSVSPSLQALNILLQVWLCGDEVIMVGFFEVRRQVLSEASDVRDRRLVQSAVVVRIRPPGNVLLKGSKVSA